MKKYIVPFTALLLMACGNDDRAGSTANTEEQSSLVATTNPENTSKFEEVTNNKQTRSLTTIEYVETEHDFGDVMYPSENLHTFRFKNTGSAPLVIEKATASCGCTIPNKPEKPILPGEYGELDVIFRPKEGQKGQTVTKKVTVVANTNPEKTYLQIKGNVLSSILNK